MKNVSLSTVFWSAIVSKNTEKKFVPKLKTWKLKDPCMKEADVKTLNDLLYSKSLKSVVKHRKLCLKIKLIEGVTELHISGLC